MDKQQQQINHIHSKLGLLSIDIFEKARQELFKKGYIIEEYISKGGEAEVFKGYSQILKRECAIRLSTNTVEGYQSFLKEYETIKHIKLPLNIVELLTVEYLEDTSISAHILELCQISLKDEMQILKDKKTWYNKEQQYYIIFSLCDALIEIQSYEILHLDIKPSNILKTMKGEYVLSDFGISKRISKNESQINKSYGYSPAFVSPEQWQNILDQKEKKTNLTPISYSSDLYSMGLVFLQILGFQIDKCFNQNIIQQQFENIKLEPNQQTIFYSFRNQLLGVDPNSRIEALKLQQFFLNDLVIKNKRFLKKYQNKVEKILNENKYNNSKNLYFSSQLHHEYSFTHFQISKILSCQLKESISLSFIGASFERLGHSDKALEYYQQSLELKKSLYLGNHPDIALSLNNIGLCYQTLGNSYKALEYYQKSLEMKELIYSSKHPDIAISLNNIGTCYETLGKADKALEYYDQSLEMKKSLYSGNHPDIALSLNNLGACYETLGKFDQALEYYQQSLEMRKVLYSGYHPDIALSLNNLGNCYESFGKADKALEYYHQSLEMRKALYSGSHPDIALSLNNIGLGYLNFGKAEQALEYFHQSLEMRKSFYSGNHPHIATSLNNIGLCYQYLGNADKALEYYQQSLEMIKYLYSGNHPHIAIFLNNLGQCYQTLGKADKALEYYQQSLLMTKSLYSGNHPDIAQSFYILGVFYETLGKADKALEYYMQSLEMRKSFYSGNHPHITQTLNNLGACYESLGNVDKALEFYQQSFEMQQLLY